MELPQKVRATCWYQLGANKFNLTQTTKITEDLLKVMGTTPQCSWQILPKHLERSHFVMELGYFDLFFDTIHWIVSSCHFLLKLHIFAYLSLPKVTLLKCPNICSWRV